MGLSHGLSHGKRNRGIAIPVQQRIGADEEDTCVTGDAAR